MKTVLSLCKKMFLCPQFNLFYNTGKYWGGFRTKKKTQPHNYSTIPVLALVPTVLLAESMWHRITHGLSDRLEWTHDPEGSLVVLSSPFQPRKS